jgi:hypothetical protein
MSSSQTPRTTGQLVGSCLIKNIYLQKHRSVTCQDIPVSCCIVQISSPTLINVKLFSDIWCVESFTFEDIGKTKVFWILCIKKITCIIKSKCHRLLNLMNLSGLYCTLLIHRSVPSSKLLLCSGRRMCSRCTITTVFSDPELSPSDTSKVSRLIHLRIWPSSRKKYHTSRCLWMYCTVLYIQLQCFGSVFFFPDPEVEAGGQYGSGSNPDPGL